MRPNSISMRTQALAATGSCLQPLSDWLDSDGADWASSPMLNHPSYWYSGVCPETGEMLRLPRTPLAEAIAHRLMQRLAADPSHHQEGKMYGILIVRVPHGRSPSDADSKDAQSPSLESVSSLSGSDQAEKAFSLGATSDFRRFESLYVLKAFSGLLNRQSHRDGWVPPIAGRAQVALAEAQTLAQLNAIKHRLLTLKHLPQRQHYSQLQQQYDQERQALRQRHQMRKRDRHRRRHQIQQSLTGDNLQRALQALERESQLDGIELRNFKRQHNEAIAPLRQCIEAADHTIRQLKRQRKHQSQQLQAQMHAAYQLTNFAGSSSSLRAIASHPLPTGTGDCCAPKLLHYAATHGLIPVAMAEFWWNRAALQSATAQNSKVHGRFYGACADRCQPIMGFLLSGLSAAAIAPQFASTQTQTLEPQASPHAFLQTVPQEDLPILYEDDWLLAISKPAHLLSVPGRYLTTQDSALTRLRHQIPNAELYPVHRLDQATSGIFLLAKTPAVYRQLSYQFQQRRVLKVYEALLPHPPSQAQGTIDLPLWGNPSDRPKQSVDFSQGKPSRTHYRVVSHLSQAETFHTFTRVEFIPITGRTHQIRVHAADAQGLGCPIAGDRLYGCSLQIPRLCLHARDLSFTHPQSQIQLHLEIESEF